MPFEEDLMTKLAWIETSLSDTRHYARKLQEELIARQDSHQTELIDLMKEHAKSMERCRAEVRELDAKLNTMDRKVAKILEREPCTPELMCAALGATLQDLRDSLATTAPEKEQFDWS